MQVTRQIITTSFTLVFLTIFPQSVTAETIPVPVDRPAHGIQLEKSDNPKPKSKTDQTENKSNTDLPNVCLTKLQKIAVAITTIQPEQTDAGCNIANPVSLISIASQTGTITLPKDMLIDCSFALTYVQWLADVADPLANRHLGSSIAKVHSGKGFTCRRRNNLPTGKLSEHAFGNAIDIIGLTLKNGDKFLVEDPSNMAPAYARFFQAMRKTACGYFTTVLGPGSNAAHATHLHLDLGIHGKTGNYKICE